jgi:hypothetical protein
MPVRTGASTCSPYAAATERNSTSTAGRQKFSGGAGGQPDLHGGTDAAQLHVPVPGGDEDATGGDDVTVLGLLHAERALAVETLGEHLGEDRRHVLDDDDRDREGRGQQRQQAGQRVRATGGRADGQHVHPLGRRLAAGGGGDQGDEARDGRGRAAQQRAQRLDLGDQLLAHAGERRRHAADVGRLGDVVVGAQRQGVQGGGRAPLGQGAEHDDRQPGVGLAQLAQGAEAVQVRHLDVEGDAVRGDLLSLASAMRPDAAVPTTVMSGSSSSTEVTSRRMTTESSTTSTLMRPIRRPV